MMKQAFAHYAYVSAAMAALFAFVLVFLGALLWVYRKGSGEIYTYVSDLPLKDAEEGCNHEQT